MCLNWIPTCRHTKIWKCSGKIGCAVTGDFCTAVIVNIIFPQCEWNATNDGAVSIQTKAI